MDVKRYKFLVAGKWKESGEPLEIKNPFNGEVVGITSRPTEGDVEEAICSAVAEAREMASLPTYRRAEILSRIRTGIIDRREELARTITLEAGKPISNSRIEVERAVFLVQLAIEECRRMGGELIPLDLLEGARGRLALTRRFPLGPVLGITPFNFPLNLVCHKLAPALAAGNPIIIKPASATPLTALILAEIVRGSGIPSGGLSVLPCSGTQAEGMVRDDRLRLLTFTGSAQVGWYLKDMAGKKRVVLELGGNAGAIVDEDTDLGYAVQRCIYGGYVYSGQTCISLQRIYVHKGIYTQFLSKLVEGVKSLKMGDPMQEETRIGPLVSQGAVERLNGWVREALSLGASALVGGKPVSDRFFEPTVLVDVRPEMKVCCEEVFGPLVTVSPFDSFEQALEEVNRTRYGLQAGVFTRDLQRAFLAYKTLEVGSVIINDVPTFRADHMPYGGVKDSGLGREGIKYAIEEMTEPRLLVLNLGSRG
ncbi:MAG: aldehyde dehydrogenase family protein [Candidatus Brocadiaceae bacterium]|nr:aldehyde dehydrogenase family protein [Candidatus Brocadiaceae bacterium]